jgi:hypothetical protein
VNTKIDGFSSDSEKTRFEPLLLKHPQSLLQNMLGGLLPGATAYANNNHNSSKPECSHVHIKLSQPTRFQPSTLAEQNPERSTGASHNQRGHVCEVIQEPLNMAHWDAAVVFKHV